MLGEGGTHFKKNLSVALRDRDLPTLQEKKLRFTFPQTNTR